MSSTKTALQSDPGIRLAFVLAIEGKDLCFCTEDSSGLATAWSATEWSTFRTGLHIIGTQESRIELFDAKITPDSLTFVVTDSQDDLLGSFFKESDEDAVTSWLDGNIGPDDTTIGVDKTDDFASSGTIYIGHEEIDYSSKNDGTDEFTVSQRGKRSLFGTSSDDEHFGRAHVTRNEDEPGIATSPQVRDTPRTWYNRTVALYAHHLEADGTWSTKADAHLVWAGKVQSYTDLGNGDVSISCVSVMEVLTNDVFHGQMRGRLQEGFDFNDDVVVHVGARGSGITAYSESETITATDSRTSWDQALNLLQEALTTINAKTAVKNASHHWDARLESVDGSDRIVIVCTKITGTHANDFACILSVIGNRAKFLRTLGWSADNPVPSKVTTAIYKDVAPESPLLYQQPVNNLSPKVYFTIEQGDWINQENSTLPPGCPSSATGLLRLGDAILVIGTVSQTGEDASAPVLGYINPAKEMSTDLARALPENVGPNGALDVRLSDGTNRAPEVSQVWLEKGTAGTLLLQLLASTGTSAYNHADYDVYDYGVGLGVPWGVIDGDSFLDLDSFAYELFLTEPVPFNELLQSVLAASNRYAVFKDGKITLVSPGQGNPYTTGLASLTESNKANSERTRVDYSANGLINRITLEYDYDVANKPRKREIIVAAASMSDFGQKRAVRIEGRGIIDGGAWREHTAAPAIAYFSRPLAIAERSIDRTQMDIVPGQAVLVTDNAIVDPRTGTRGVTNMPAWVLARQFDWRTMSGYVSLAFLGEVDWERAGTWSPSAEVNTSSTTMGSATTTLVCHANKFSDSGASADATEFVAGDKVRIVELSPSNTASPSEFFRTVDSQSGNNIELTASVTLTSGKRYVVEPDDAGTVQTTQQNHAFLADDADQSLASGVEPYIWSHDSDAITLPSATLDYSQEFMWLDDQADDKAEPLSVRKFNHFAQVANNLLGVKTSRILLNTVLKTERQFFEDEEELIVPPILCPYYGALFGGIPTKSLKIQLRGKISTGSSNTATYTVRASSNLVSLRLRPVGGTFEPTFSGGTTSTTITTTSTSYGYLTGSISIPAIAPGQPPFFWLTVTGKLASEGGSEIGWLSGVMVREADAGE